MAKIPRLQVREFVALVNQTLEAAYPFVEVEGEVSGFRVSKNKWVNFTLKDEEAAINCFMTVWQLKTPMEDGMQVIVGGNPSLYKKTGRFTLKAQKVTPSGEGALKRAYELLKKKLTKEGLFEEARKRPLPDYPQRIGVISSKQAAGYDDFINLLKQRWGGLQIQLINVQVQGEPAPAQITAAINQFNQLKDPPDVLAMLRGGGSLEDLHAFNTEEVTRAVASSRVPIVVGVGHERDVTLAGLAADKRASTPTNAAELIVPSRETVLDTLSRNEERMDRALTNFLRSCSDRIARYVSRIEHQLTAPLQHIDSLEDRLRVYIDQTVRSSESKVDSLLRTLKGYNPEQVLKRGYSIARTERGVLRDAGTVKIGEIVMLQLAKGKLETKVEDVKKQ